MTFSPCNFCAHFSGKYLERFGKYSFLLSNFFILIYCSSEPLKSIQKIRVQKFQWNLFHCLNFFLVPLLLIFLQLVNRKNLPWDFILRLQRKTDFLLKLNSHVPKYWFYLVLQSPFKMVQNVSYFTLEAIVVCKIFKVLPWLFGHTKKPGLIGKTRLISKYMT